MQQRFWQVRLSYRIPELADRRRYRDNAVVGVVAPTIEAAIHEAKAHIPDGGDEARVWGVQDRGPVHCVADGG